MSEDTVTSIPAQPGYFITELVVGDHEYPWELSETPIVAWSIIRCDDAVWAEPIGLISEVEKYIIKCPNGKYFFVGGERWFETAEECLKHLRESYERVQAKHLEEKLRGARS